MPNPNITNITPPRVPMIDEKTGYVSREWYRFFYNVFIAIGGQNQGTIQTIQGGTGTSNLPANGDLLIGNGQTDAYAVSQLNVGNGLSKSVAPGFLQLDNTGVLSIDGDTTGLTPTGATAGNVVLGGVLNETHGGTNQSSYATGDTLYASSANTLSKLSKPSATAMLTMNSSGSPTWKVPKYGAFHDTTASQTAAANTPTAITYNATDYSNGISIGTPTSRVVVDTAGLYNIQFSIQLTNSDASIDDVAVWLRVNGNDVANTASWAAVPSKHAGIDGSLILALNIFYQFAANDYFELVWMTVNGTTSITTIPASGVAPVYPASPGVILTVSDNIAA